MTARVQAAAESLGYRPNVAARALTTGRSAILGLILPTDQLTSDPYGARLVAAVTSRAAESNHAVMLWLSHRAPELDATMLNGVVDGLIISIVAQNDPWVTALLDGPLPYSFIGRHAKRADASYATVDNVSGTRALMSHLLECGYRRIAMVRGPIGNADADERYATYVEALRSAGLDHDLIAVGDFRYLSGYKSAQQLLRHRPDCIVAANDHMAWGAVDAVRDAGLAIPADVAVTGWDDMDAFRRPSLGLTTVSHNVEAVGREATGILLELLAGGTRPIRRTIRSSLVVRDSTCAEPDPHAQPELSAAPRKPVRVSVR